MLKEISNYRKSEYYNKFGKVFDNMELYANTLGKEWDYYIVMYDELAKIIECYFSFMRDNLEDLKLYALMYRNVSLGQNSIYDKAFFLNNKEKIIGYKNRIYSLSASKKEVLVRYYYKYDDLFEMYCKKRVERVISTKKKATWPSVTVSGRYFPVSYISIEDLQKIRKGQFGEGSGLNDLSDEESSILLEHIEELTNNRSTDLYTADMDIYTDKKDFIKERILPYYFDGSDIYKKLINDYINNKYKRGHSRFLSQKQYERGEFFLLLKDQYKLKEYINSNDKIISLKKEKDNLEHPTLYLLPDNPYVDPEEKRKIEDLRTLLKTRNKEIKEMCDNRIKSVNEKIEKKEKEIKDSLHKDYNSFIDELSLKLNSDNDSFWWYLYNNQSELISFYSQLIVSQFRNIVHNQLREWIEYKCFPISWRPVSNDQFSRAVNGFPSRETFETKIEKSCNSSVTNGATLWNKHIEGLKKEHVEEERKRAEEDQKRREEEEEKRKEQYRFNIRNRHLRDSKVSFRETDHVYIVDGIPFDSVTTFVKNCFPDFDAEFHAKRRAEALGITKEAVLEMWDKKGKESREQGTAMHKKIESYYLGKEPSTDDTFELFKIFANKITLKPYRTEWAVYDWEQKIAGTIDFVDYQNGEYIIYDWKRSDKLIAKNGLPIKNSQYGEKALPPIENLDNSPYYHYALQLSLYKYILEKNYGINISKLRLGIFHPSYNKPYVLEMPYMQNEIDTLFGLRSEVVF